MSEPEQEATDVVATTPGIDSSKLSNEQLKALIDTGQSPEQESEQQERAEPAEPVEEAQEQEEPAEEQAAEEPKEAAEEEQIDPRQARLDEAIATAKHFESVAGRLGGRLGYVERQNKELESQLSQVMAAIRRASHDGAESEAYQQPQPQPQPVQPATDRNMVFMSEQAVRNQFVDFARRHPDILDEKTGAQGIDRDYMNELNSRVNELQMLTQSGNAPDAATQAEQIYAESYSKLARDRAIRIREEAERRTLDQAEKLKKKKRAQAAAGKSAKSATPKPKTLTVKDLKTEDLKRLIDSRAGLD